jgi:hypothetical protein
MAESSGRFSDASSRVRSLWRRLARTSRHNAARLRGVRRAGAELPLDELVRAVWRGRHPRPRPPREDPPPGA